MTDLDLPDGARRGLKSDPGARQPVAPRESQAQRDTSPHQALAAPKHAGNGTAARRTQTLADRANPTSHVALASGQHNEKAYPEATGLASYRRWRKPCL